MTTEKLKQEFNKQVENLIIKGYPQTAEKTNEEFLKLIEPLKNNLPNLPVPDIDIEKGSLPFVIVVKDELVPTEKTMSLVEKDGKQGITKLFPHEPKDFQTINEESIPENHVYLLIDIDRGKEYINITPHEAMIGIREKHRHPLTIDEGIAIITHYPEFLIKNNCFSLLASRNPNDKRVPAIWINANKNPNLGWCWEGNPHTWLGSASCRERIN